MAVLIFDHDVTLAAWAAARIAHVGEIGFGPCAAIGIAAGNGLDDALYAVCVFHDYQGRAGTVQVSLAARSPKWATPGTLRALLHYPFRQLGVNKLWVAIPHDNQRALRFNQGIGMVREAVLRQHFGPNRHAVSLSMLQHEYRRSRWFRGNGSMPNGHDREAHDGQVVVVATAGT